MYDETLKKYKNDFRTKKSHAFNFVEPTSDGKRLYYQGRSDYKGLLIKLLIKTVDKLNELGVNVRVKLGDDKQTRKAA